MDTNYTTENCTAMGNSQTRNYAKMPKIKYFRVQARGAVKDKDTKQWKDRANGAWAVLVCLEGSSELRLVTDVAREQGMFTIKGEFKTKQDAFDAAMQYKAKWGVATSKSGKKREDDKKQTEATERENMVKAMRALNMSDDLINAVLAQRKAA